VWRPPFCPSGRSMLANNGQQSIHASATPAPRASDRPAQGRRLMQAAVKRPAGSSSAPAKRQPCRQQDLSASSGRCMRFTRIAHSKAITANACKIAWPACFATGSTAHRNTLSAPTCSRADQSSRAYTRSIKVGKAHGKLHRVAAAGLSSNRSAQCAGKPVLGQILPARGQATDRFSARCPQPEVVHRGISHWSFQGARPRSGFQRPRYHRPRICAWNTASRQ